MHPMAAKAAMILHGMLMSFAITTLRRRDGFGALWRPHPPPMTPADEASLSVDHHVPGSEMSAYCGDVGMRGGSSRGV
ncbi:hypothetical protein DJ021_00650 [Phenylobacterium hankyongense]|uniref:Uncharacterized protein n=1 Tax=Phenylobacterium hankyongense TaxID=1813876 RepID=A0A328AUX1_9CAUL|nr:hypothetical protein DJ021_00650 [Phenylobacterium hankyongense]